MTLDKFIDDILRVEKNLEHVARTNFLTISCPRDRAVALGGVTRLKLILTAFLEAEEATRVQTPQLPPERGLHA